MKLKTLSTGSVGNCYLLKTDSETLMLDAGIKLNEIKKGLDYDIMSVAGVVVSHLHRDHSYSALDLQKMGLEVYKPYEKAVSIKKMGDFRIQVFRLPHNDTINFGFYIKVDDRKILYMTDFEYCSFNFQKLGITDIIIECNYIYSMVDRNSPNYEHKIRGHCALTTCTNFIKNNTSNSLKNVVLIHLGTKTTDVDIIREEVSKVTNANIYFARKGEEIIL